MAHALQTITPQGNFRPLAHVPKTRVPGEPLGQLVFNGSAALTAIGVGDTGGLLLEMLLPGNFVYTLERTLLSVGTAIGSINWDFTAFRIYWSPLIGTAPAATTQNQYPMGSCSVRDAENNYLVMGVFSGNDNGGRNMDPDSAYSRVPPIQGGYGAGTSPAVMINNPTASTAAQTLSWILIWNVFPSSDYLKMLFHRRVPVSQ